MTAAFHTLGCKTNAYETQAVMQQFREAGFQIGDFAQSCDVYVINTCAVTQEAARKSRQMSRRCKRNNPDSLVIVTGCYAQDAGEQLLRDGTADIVVGNSEKNRILPLVQERLSTGMHCEEGRKILMMQDMTHWTQYERQMITEQEDHVRAYVKIQDGCDRFCSYCLIPYLRGRSRSRRKEDILQEVRGLAQRGYQEVVLTGIDISTFRTDSKPEDDLAFLLEDIAAVPGIRRIRLGSLEAGIASEGMVRRLREVEAFCPQFHLSLQSGSDTVLRRMNRHYSTAAYVQTVAMIRDIFPLAAVTTDVITGFPGETEEEFRETVDFSVQMAFSRMHVFPYSRRAGTRADSLPGQLTKAVKEQRARELISVGEQLRQTYEESYIGKSCCILAEEIIRTQSGECYAAGLTPEYVRILVRIAQNEETLSDGQSLINRFLDVVPSRFADGVLFCDAQDAALTDCSRFLT